MANYKQHIFAGLLLSLTSLFWLNKGLDWIMVLLIGVIIFIFSQLPDIDHTNSKITWMTLNIGALVLLTGSLIKYMVNIGVITSTLDITNFGILLILVMIFFAQTTHRGITHTIWFVFSMPFFLLFIPNLPNVWLLIGFGIISGYSHLIMDGYLFKMSLKPIKGRW